MIRFEPSGGFRAREKKCCQGIRGKPGQTTVAPIKAWRGSPAGPPRPLTAGREKPGIRVFAMPIFRQFLTIAGNDFLHRLHVPFQRADESELAAAAVEIVALPLDLEIDIAVQIVC